MDEVVENSLDLTSKSINDLSEIANQILDFAGNCRIILLQGELGSGKTTLIQHLCKALDVDDFITSPTFAIVNEYHTVIGSPVYHFDFYRISNVLEAQAIGIEEYLNSGVFCFIEWPDRIALMLPETTVLVSLITQKDNSRLINLSRNG